MTRTWMGVVALLGLAGLSSCDKEADKTAKKDPSPVAKPKPETGGDPVAPAASKCPAATTITALESSTDITAAGPFDLKTFTFAKAKLSSDGAELKVYVSNKDWSLDRLSSLPSPVENNGEAYVTLTFKAKDAAALVGAYSPKNRDAPGDREVSAGLMVKGNALGTSLGDTKVEVAEKTDARVCGSFDLFGEHEFEGKRTHLAGTFVADL